ncbi:flagellar hook capping protein [Nocardioides albidus]|uniref:Flagellar hook capping protein n=1 Tax=Nocardioides albidus TaxID=1517589 RepID=A0A5C4W7K2_9ACTN|nr:flagellar hook capping FlgD N-terminal domain-containing protein [Nocardioides albidus]TNM44197.1 flagellar hook capping protein [Nocardioides albidus]
MSVSSTEGVGYGVTGTAPTGAGGTPGASGTSTKEDKDLFLQLMVAQMKYQDPLNPTDSSQFLAQTAQFTALEKMQDIAEQSALMVSTQLAFGASSLIGQTVRWYDASGAEQTGTVQGTTYLNTGPVLSIDGKSVPVTDVISVGDAPTIKAPTTTGGGTSVPPSGTPSTTA